MADAYDVVPCAKKIVNINDGLVLEVESLREIFLHEDIEDKRVCVISIAGAFRQGKSFLLNFFLRYLTVTCTGKRDLTHWLTPEDGPISGFSWRGGSKTVTSGILIWSEIFLSRLPSGEEMAVVLMDTQGAFDKDTTLKNCAAVFALSTLISSVQIYNLKDNVKSSDLAHLQFFSEYGKLLKQCGNEKPFQNLLFLIRDWTNPQENPYGMEGGRRFIDNNLNTEDGKVSPEMISLRDGIKELFDRIDCFLLPHPGLKVTQFDFSGQLEDIDENFKKYVEILATTVLSPTKLVPKVINGEYIKVKHLIELFENYCEQFKNKDMPKVETLFTATANIHHKMTLEEAEILYDNEMEKLIKASSEGIEECVLFQEHERVKNAAIKYFTDKKIIGDEQTKIENMKKLEEKLQERFPVYNYLNKLKLLEEKERRMQKQMENQRSQLSDLETELSEERETREQFMKEYQKSEEEQKKKLEELQNQLGRTRNWNRFINWSLQLGLIYIAPRLGLSLLSRLR